MTSAMFTLSLHSRAANMEIQCSPRQPMPESPKHAKTLVVGRPNVLDEQGFLEDVKTILRSKLLTNGGPFVSQLEQGARE